MVLEDRALITETIQHLTNKQNVEYSFNVVVERYINFFKTIEDEYLRESLDIKDVSEGFSTTLLEQLRMVNPLSKAGLLFQKISRHHKQLVLIKIIYLDLLQIQEVRHRILLSCLDRLRYPQWLVFIMRLKKLNQMIIY